MRDHAHACPGPFGLPDGGCAGIVAFRDCRDESSMSRHGRVIQKGTAAECCSISARRDAGIGLLGQVKSTTACEFQRWHDTGLIFQLRLQGGFAGLWRGARILIPARAPPRSA